MAWCPIIMAWYLIIMAWCLIIMAWCITIWSVYKRSHIFYTILHMQPYKQYANQHHWLPSSLGFLYLLYLYLIYFWYIVVLVSGQLPPGHLAQVIYPQIVTSKQLPPPPPGHQPPDGYLSDNYSPPPPQTSTPRWLQYYHSVMWGVLYLFPI